MIHTNRIVTVGEQECIIDRPIVLYRGDREVEIEFTLVGNEFMFSEDGNVIKSVNASHGQLVLNTPSGEHMFSELAECHEGKVVFVVTKEMIDEFIEMGFYSFQIRLYDSAEMKSRVTIPPVMNGFDIRNPIAAEDETNVVDQGIVDYARIFKDQSNEELPTFTWDGEYVKTEWAHHDVITENKMNKIEDALYSINANIKESDVVMLNALDNVKKDADKYVKEHMAEVEADVDEFERNLNTDVQQFKIDTNAAMTAHKNEVSEELESVNSQLAHIENLINEVSIYDLGGVDDCDISNILINAITKNVKINLKNGRFKLTKPVVNNGFDVNIVGDDAIIESDIQDYYSLFYFNKTNNINIKGIKFTNLTELNKVFPTKAKARTLICLEEINNNINIQNCNFEGYGLNCLAVSYNTTANVNISNNNFTFIRYGSEWYDHSSIYSYSKEDVFIYNNKLTSLTGGKYSKGQTAIEGGSSKTLNVYNNRIENYLGSFLANKNNYFDSENESYKIYNNVCYNVSRGLEIWTGQSGDHKNLKNIYFYNNTVTVTDTTTYGLSGDVELTGKLLSINPAWDKEREVSIKNIFITNNTVGFLKNDDITSKNGFLFDLSAYCVIENININNNIINNYPYGILYTPCLIYGTNQDNINKNINFINNIILECGEKLDYASKKSLFYIYLTKNVMINSNKIINNIAKPHNLIRFDGRNIGFTMLNNELITGEEDYKNDIVYVGHDLITGVNGLQDAECDLKTFENLTNKFKTYYMETPEDLNDGIYHTGGVIYKLYDNEKPVIVTQLPKMNLQISVSATVIDSKTLKCNDVSKFKVGMPIKIGEEDLHYIARIDRDNRLIYLLKNIYLYDIGNTVTVVNVSL